MSDQRRHGYTAEGGGSAGLPDPPRGGTGERFAAPSPSVEQMIEELLRETGRIVEIDIVDDGTYAARVGGGRPEVYAGSVRSALEGLLAAWRERRNDG